jgi:hypothetical protein
MLMPMAIGSAADAVPAATISNGDKASKANRFIPVSCYEIWNLVKLAEPRQTATAETEQYRLVMPRYRNIIAKISSAFYSPLRGLASYRLQRFHLMKLLA